jgi:hypothetical protein
LVGIRYSHGTQLMNYLRSTLQATMLLLLFPLNSTAHIYTGGLHYMRSPDLVIEHQDVTISVDQITVSYQLHNTSSMDLIETMVFPAPVQISIDNQVINYNSSQRAISTDGRDVTNILKSLGLAFDPITAMHSIDASPNRDTIRNKLIGAKLLDKDESPQWFVQSFYYWQQVFPAGASITINQSYKPQVNTNIVQVKGKTGYLNIPGNLLKKLYNLTIKWRLEDQITAANLQAQLEKYNPHITQYCPSLADYQTILGPMSRPESEISSIETKELNYNYLADDIWATPIARFSLKILSQDDIHPILCWNGEFKKQGKNTLVFEATNYVPLHNLKVLYVEK